ncbi:MAG: PrgI family protein [Parcubacteria group bacterium]|nr:PrgI family protein [Parcubacteria group bacterium]
MRFQVPQFTEVEDKIVGPLTFKQFIYLAGGIGICIALYKFLPLIIAIILIIPIAILSIALAFYKVNNRPYILMLESMFQYYITKKLYIWKKEPKKTSTKEEGEAVVASQVYVPKLSNSKLKDLTWSLDINENPNPGTKETGNK